MFGRLAMGFANVRAGTRVLMLVLVQAESPGGAGGSPERHRTRGLLPGRGGLAELLRSECGCGEGAN